MIERQDVDCCMEISTHPELIDKVLQHSLNEENVMKLAEIFKVLGDPTRIKIIHTLATAELCVCDIAEAISMTQSAVSHQLRILRNMRLVKYYKQGKSVYYSLDDEHILNLFNEGLQHVMHG